MKLLEQNFFYLKCTYSFDQINKYFVLNRLSCSEGEYLIELSFQWYADGPKQKHFQRKSNLSVIQHQKNPSLTSMDSEGFANWHKSLTVLCSELEKASGLQTMREHLCLLQKPSTEAIIASNCCKSSFFSVNEDCKFRILSWSYQTLRKFARLGLRREWKTRTKSSFKSSLGLTRKMALLFSPCNLHPAEVFSM